MFLDMYDLILLAEEDTRSMGNNMPIVCTP